MKQNYNQTKQKEKATMSLTDIQQELGISRKVATAWAKQFLNYKRINRQYIFSRKQFLEIIEEAADVEYKVTY